MGRSKKSNHINLIVFIINELKIILCISEYVNFSKMKIVKAFIIVLLISSCKKTEIINDRNVSFSSDSLNVFGKLSDSRLIYPNITYRLNHNETILFERNYSGVTNHFSLNVFVDGVQYSLNNEYFFEIK